tara:strand:+ start:488 stop:730 length:243 start_codon:yes stop_codon:yes gene_type:complete
MVGKYVTNVGRSIKMQMITKERSYDLLELSEVELNVIQCAMSWYQVKLTDQVNKRGYIEERLNFVEEMVTKLDFEEKVNE